LKTKFLPTLVRQLGLYCDAWLVGGSVDDDNPKDYDVVVPYSQWNKACMLLPKEVKFNTFGGIKCVSDGFSIDVWIDDLTSLCTSNKFSVAMHINSGNIIERRL